MQAAWNRNGYRLIGIWQPEWRMPIFPGPTQSPGLAMQSLNPRNPATQLGFKIDRSGEQMDFSLSYAHVISRSPDFSVIYAGAQATNLGIQFNHVDVFGADAARVIGDYGIRFEAAYTATHDNAGRDLLSQNSNLFAVLGIDRTFDGVFNINVQYLYRHTFDWQAPNISTSATIGLLAAQENLASNQLAANMHGASVRVYYKAYHETLEYEVGAISWFTRNDLAFRPKISYAFSDHIKGILGAQIYSGPDESFFGRLRRTSTGFAEFRFNF